MMYHSHVPLYMWVEAFQTAVFLLNRLPTTVLGNETPFYMLHGFHFDYSSLRVFGSKCFPYIWDSKAHKFDPKSCLCVFVGYSEKHKGYKCFNPRTKKFIISRHVSFDEAVFPFKSTSADPSFALQVMNSWLPASSSLCTDSDESNQNETVFPSLQGSVPSEIATSPDSSHAHNTSILPSEGEATQVQQPAAVVPSAVVLQPSSTSSVLQQTAADFTAVQSPVLSHVTVPVPTDVPETSSSVLNQVVVVADSSAPAQSSYQGPEELRIADQVQQCSTIPDQQLFVSNDLPEQPTETHSLDCSVSESLVSQFEKLSLTAPGNSASLDDTMFDEHALNLPSSHTMITRSKSGIVKPNPKYALNVTVSPSIPPEPKSVKHALAHSGWKNAMLDEFNALIKNETWTLVPRTADLNVIGCKWVYKAKLKPDGTLERLKARLVAKGFHQLDGVDYTETFSPVIKPGTIRLVLTVALVRGWPIRQLDVKNAFLHGFISENIYMEQPPGMIDSAHPSYVCKLQRALYGLKQAPRAWFDRLSVFLIKYGFYCSLADPSLFIFHSSTGILVLLIYVDDMLLTGSSPPLVQSFLQVLNSEFSMKDLGPLHHFLGIQIHTTPTGLHLSQTHYAHSILKRAQMLDCRPMPTPSVQNTVSTPDDTTVDPRYFRGLVGSLQYLTLTRPDLSFSVNYVSQFMHTPDVSHLKFVRRILRYLKGTIHYGLSLTANTSLVLSAFSDADWAGCPTTRRSTTGYCTFLGSNIISWCAKKQNTVARSSTEAEYRAMAHAAAELTWLGYLLADLRVPIHHPPVLHGDNLSALYLTVNPVLHARSKHIALDYHYVRERVAQGVLTTKHIPSSLQLADIFTKPMTKARLAQFRHKLCLQPRQSLRGDNDLRGYKDANIPLEL